MCAMLVGNPWGELRGKLGGNVFARNGHGAYVRQFVVPINPNTVAQSNARDSFRNVVGEYSQLNALYRNQWNEYAVNFYVPRVGSISNRYSGYQAYVALHILARQAVAYYRPVYYKLDGAEPEVDMIGDDFNSFYVQPPNVNKTNTAKDYNNSEFELAFTQSALDIAGNVEFTVSLVGAGSPKKFTQFRDSNDNYMGFALYASNPVAGKNLFIESELAMCVGYFRSWHTQEILDESVEFINLKYQSYDTFPVANYQKWPMVGQWVRMTLFSVDKFGQMLRIGSLMTEVESD